LVRIHDAELDERTDFRALVRSVLDGVGPMRVDPWGERSHLNALLQLDDALRGTALVRRLRGGAVDLLTAHEPRVRASALAFLVERPPDDATQIDRVLEILVRDAAHFDPPPRSQMIGKLAARSSRALVLARAEATRRHCPPVLLVALAEIDAGWLADHAERIVRGSPEVLGPMLMLLKRHGHDVVSIVERLAPMGLLSGAEFRSAIESHVPDPETWRRIQRSTAS
jgi:hypothetical protein